MGKEAFYFCGLENLELPDTVEVLDEKAFFKCMYLTEVKLPESIRRIEKWVFHGCARLQVLEIRHDPEYIGEWIINKAARIRCYRGSKWLRTARSQDLPWSTSIRKRMIWKKGRSRNEVSDEFYNIVGRRLTRLSRKEDLQQFYKEHGCDGLQVMPLPYSTQDAPEAYQGGHCVSTDTTGHGNGCSLLLPSGLDESKQRGTDHSLPERSGLCNAYGCRICGLSCGTGRQGRKFHLSDETHEPRSD